jgi:excisionase family DNA binding protein
MSECNHCLPLLTTAEVASILRCSKAHVSNLINGKAGLTTAMPVVRLGRRTLIRREVLIQWLSQNTTGIVVPEQA